MRIIIEEDVFAGKLAEEDHGSLLELFLLSLSGRHTIEVSPEDSAPFRGWLGERDEATRSMFKRAQDAAIKQRARRRRVTIRVAKVAAPSWPERRMPLSTALDLARKPLTLLFENDRYERKFLSVISRLRRDFELESLVSRGAVDPRTHGGVDENRKWLDKYGKAPEVALRHWVMCDSDARRSWEHPKDGTVSKDLGSGASKMVKVCKECGIRLHVLRRRFIESYIPLPAFQKWSTWGGSDRAEKHDALSRLTPAQRHYYNMKKGFTQDAKDVENARKVGNLYDGLDSVVRQSLADGIAENIADLFFEQRFGIAEQWLERDVQQREVDEIVDGIMELI
jgi:hypothetical protein